MKQYNRIMLGKGGQYSKQCVQEGFIGGNYNIRKDLTDFLNKDFEYFKNNACQIYLQANPAKTKVSASLCCKMLWTICKGLNIGDIILSPNGDGEYYVGQITGDYYYDPNNILPHRRPVEWFKPRIARIDMSQELRNATGIVGTCCDITQYASEIDCLINIKTTNSSIKAEIEDYAEFEMEKHLEDFLIKNWRNTPLGRNYDIYEEDGEPIGKQYPSDTGPMDILAISKDKKELLVIELKKGRVSDVVIGQIQRYMGYISSELAEPDQTVKGVIIGLNGDLKLKRALSMTNNIEFYKYKINFSLEK
ncbi:MAG: endonuclease NucS domain-containing protein [Bacteroidales bacterium]